MAKRSGPSISVKMILTSTLLILLTVLASSLYWVSRPGRVPTLLLERIGTSLDLEISAGGATEYRLRGTPMHFA